MTGSKTTPEPGGYTRAEVNTAAARLAKNLRRFIEEAHLHVPLHVAYTLTTAAIDLEDVANAR